MRMATRQRPEKRPKYNLPTGATINAASASRVDVQTAIDASSSGDTVVIPNGSATWTTGVDIIGKAIHVRAATVGGVTLTHNASDYLFTITEATAGSVRVSGIAFAGGTGTLHTVALLYASGGQPILIHDNTWTGSINAITVSTNRGVIYSNTIDTGGLDKSFVQCKPEGLLLASWEAASTMGTADTTGALNLYIEDNTITDVPYQAFDPDGNSRVVIRYNTFQDSGMASHGPDTGTYGNRHTEVYNNTFAFTDLGNDPPPAALDYFMYIRGGVWVITDNTIPDLNTTYLGNKAEIKMQVQNLRRNAGPMPCYSGSYPMPRQIGVGHNGTAYISDPVYIWNNTGGGNYASPSLENYSPDECSGGQDISTFVQLGRDVIVDGTARPGYTKYTYPHPLR